MRAYREDAGDYWPLALRWYGDAATGTFTHRYYQLYDAEGNLTHVKTSAGMTVERWQHNRSNRVPTQLFVTDVANDTGATGANGGTNEGDYNAFFSGTDGFFTGANVKTDLDQDGDADTADYNRFMDTYFEAPAQGRAAGSVFKTVYLAAGQMYDDTLSGPTDPATVTLTARSRWVGEGERHCLRSTSISMASNSLPSNSASAANSGESGVMCSASICLNGCYDLCSGEASLTLSYSFRCGYKSSWWGFIGVSDNGSVDMYRGNIGSAVSCTQCAASQPQPALPFAPTYTTPSIPGIPVRCTGTWNPAQCAGCSKLGCSVDLLNVGPVGAIKKTIETAASWLGVSIECKISGGASFSSCTCVSSSGSCGIKSMKVCISVCVSCGTDPIPILD